jgi:hypothetical protein
MEEVGANIKKGKNPFSMFGGNKMF